MTVGTRVSLAVGVWSQDAKSKSFFLWKPVSVIRRTSPLMSRRNLDNWAEWRRGFKTFGTGSCSFPTDSYKFPTAMDKGNGRLRKDLSLVRMQPLPWKKKRFLCNLISHVPVTLTLSTPWMRAHLETVMCNFGRNRAVCVVVKAICAKSLQTDRQTMDAARLY